MEGKRYDAEFYIAHVENTERKNGSNREDKVAMTSFLFDASEKKKMNGLKSYLKGGKKLRKRKSKDALVFLSHLLLQLQSLLQLLQQRVATKT